MKNLKKQFLAIAFISAIALAQPMRGNLSKDDKIDLGLIITAGLATTYVVDAIIRYERNKAAERSLKRLSLDFELWYLKKISIAGSQSR